jgi:KaiC/GvpD/RAD55 family RecA-like ATPase
MRNKGTAGEPLPTVFHCLAREGVHIRRGQLTLIAAAPGVGKSLISLTLAVRAGVPALYFSADTDQDTMTNRAAAMVTQWRVSDIEQAKQQGLTERINAQLEKLMFVRMDFDANPSLTYLEGNLKAFEMVYGEFPALIVIDNVSNVDNESGEGGTQSLEYSFDFLHQMARDTGAAVVLLHHVTGDYDDGTKPVPLSGLRGKVSKVPECILTLHRTGGDSESGLRRLGISPVKNRTGKSDPSGNWFLTVDIDLERMGVRG